MKWTDYRNSILATIDNESYFRSVFDNIQSRGTEWKVSCPFAETKHAGGADKNPSCMINVSKGTYYCTVCGSKGNIHTLHKELNNLTSEQAWYEFGDALSIERPDTSKPTRPDIDIGLVSEYHQALMKLTGPIRTVLSQRRGLTDKTLMQFRLGWDGERITIPVYDEYNTLVNFRLYKWNSDEDTYKVLNYVDTFGNAYGEIRLFGIENLVDDTVKDIVWSEGELDRVCSEQNGFPAACPTSGAGTFKVEWLKLLRGKRVYIAQDNDEAGRNAAKKLCEIMSGTCEVYVIQWPEDFPVKGDITDFYTKCGFTAKDFQKLKDTAILYTGAASVAQDTEEAIEVHLSNSANAEHYGKRIKVPVLISGKDSAPFICPKTIHITCDGALSDNKKCIGCGMQQYGGDYHKVIASTDKLLMQMIKCTEKQQEATIREMVGIKSKCLMCAVDIIDYMNVEEVRMIPKAESDFNFKKESEYVVRTGYIISTDIKTNKRYSFEGYMYPDPQTQYANYVFDKAVPEKDMISDFEMTPEVHERLKIFQPRAGQTIEQKFDEIHRDLERNITRVWERRDVAIGVDLIYHTVLSFYFQEQYIKRGWGELLIIGDSGQAKSTLVERLMQHYRLGEMISGESSKRTGLVYSMQQTSKRWFLVWGAFPLNDTGLITLDELSGLAEDDLALMSDVRSSGVARATGVITAETNSRTRAIFISNPRNGRQLNAETYGVQSVLKLFGKAEDVRRLDLTMAVASGDVDAELINKSLADMTDVPHQFTSELSNLSIMWAWSRKPDNVVFEKEAVTTILKRATEMGKQYYSAIPIVEAADQRLKIARLAIACACSMYSTEDGVNVIVKAEHVDFIVAFMHKLYAKPSLGYDKYSKDNMVKSDDSDDNLQRLREKFALIAIMDPNEIIKILHQLPYFSRAVLEDYTGLMKDDLKMLIKFLTNESLVERYRGDYRRYPIGTKFIESLMANPLTQEEIDKLRQKAYEGGAY